MYPSADLTSATAWIKSVSSDQVNSGSKFCGTVGLWSKTETFKFDAKAQTCADSNIKTAANICIKEIKLCKSSGSSRKKRQNRKPNKNQQEEEEDSAEKPLCLHKQIKHCNSKEDLLHRDRCLLSVAKENKCRVKTGPNPIETSFDPMWQFFGKQIETQKQEGIKEKFKQLNLTHAYKNIFDILWQTQLPCYDVQRTTSTTEGEHGMLKSCHWRGKQVACSKIFTMMPTDRGMCCSFNIKKAETLFADGIFTKTVTDLQKRDKQLAFDKLEKIPFDPAEKLFQTMAGKSKDSLFLAF